MTEADVERDLREFVEARWTQAYGAAYLLTGDRDRARALLVRALAGAGSERGPHSEPLEAAVYRRLAAGSGRSGRRELALVLRYYAGLDESLVADLLGTTPHSLDRLVGGTDPAAVRAEHAERLDLLTTPVPNDREVEAEARRLRRRRRSMGWVTGIATCFCLLIVVALIAANRPPPRDPVPPPPVDPFSGRGLVAFVSDSRLGFIEPGESTFRETDISAKKVLGLLDDRVVVLAEQIELADVDEGRAESSGEWQGTEVSDAVMSADGDVLARRGDELVTGPADGGSLARVGRSLPGERLLDFDGTTWLSTDGRRIWQGDLAGDREVVGHGDPESGSIRGEYAVVTIGVQTEYLLPNANSVGPHGVLSPGGRLLIGGGLSGDGQQVGGARIQEAGSARTSVMSGGVEAMLVQVWWPDSQRAIVALDADGRRELWDCLVSVNTCQRFATAPSRDLQLPGYQEGG
jgi:hypothetical protein